MANPQRALEKWKANMAAAGQAMIAGVDDVQINPAEQAIAAAPKYIANVNKAYAEGRYQSGLAGVTLTDWKSAMKGKGATNMANGARNISARAAKNITDVVAYTNSVRQQIASMPSMTESDMDARCLAAIALMRAYRKSRT